jgi:hypothetical protein
MHWCIALGTFASVGLVLNLILSRDVHGFKEWDLARKSRRLI